MYRLAKTPLGVDYILRLEDNANIPMDEDNRDYQEYLEWVAQGNTPLPPDD
jgi:hypothetical protein